MFTMQSCLAQYHQQQVLPKVIWEKRVATPTSENADGRHDVAAAPCTAAERPFCVCQLLHFCLLLKRIQHRPRTSLHLRKANET